MGTVKIIDQDSRLRYTGEKDKFFLEAENFATSNSKPINNQIKEAMYKHIQTMATPVDYHFAMSYELAYEQAVNSLKTDLRKAESEYLHSQVKEVVDSAAANYTLIQKELKALKAI